MKKIAVAKDTNPRVIVVQRYQWLALCMLTLICLTNASFSFGQENLPALIKKTESSIVVIATYSKNGKVLGQGTGFFVNQDGDVISNLHVLRGADGAFVKTNDGAVYPIKRVQDEDRIGDLIRISVDIPRKLVRPLRVTSSLPEVGEQVIVIGTPLGFEKTVSDGIVSAIREIPDFGRVIQVTAPISPGSSGSPVLNMRGNVIGVATFFIAAGQNLNFAIPGERVVRLRASAGKTLSEWGNAFQEETIVKQKDVGKGLSEKNKKEGEAFLSENKKKEGVRILPSGLQYNVITAGKGKKPKVTDTVTTHYRGTLIDGTEFDSSARRGKPATFPVNGVIPGWTEALQLMEEGAKWEVFIPPGLAYGERGTPGGPIGPNATLIFEIELISIQEKK
jgi:FKBP-type peptidyl-prolyl cis-trans isomerase